MPEDDPTIFDSDVLLRRVPIKPQQIVKDENLGRYRPSSAAFNDHPNGSAMSVNIRSGVFTSQRREKDVLPLDPPMALAGIRVSTVRGAGLGTVRAPVADQIAHGEVIGDKTKPVRRALATEAFWVVLPPESVD